MPILSNIYKVRLNNRGEVEMEFSNGERATLTQENAANLAAHVVTILEADAWDQYSAWVEQLESGDRESGSASTVA